MILMYGEFYVSSQSSKITLDAKAGYYINILLEDLHCKYSSYWLFQIYSMLDKDILMRSIIIR
jgi:hypothetical protein